MSEPFFTVAMEGPESTISVHLRRPTSFVPTFSSATRLFTMQVTRPVAGVQTLLTLGPGDWSWAQLTASSGVAVYTPDGTEFPEHGWAEVAMQLSLNGTVYPLQSMTLKIRKNTRVVLP